MFQRTPLTNQAELKTKYENLPICPLTQDTIVMPVLIFCTPDGGTSQQMPGHFEYAALKKHIATCKRENKPITHPTARYLIDRIELDLKAFNEWGDLIKNAHQVGLIEDEELTTWQNNRKQASLFLLLEPANANTLLAKFMPEQRELEKTHPGSLSRLLSSPHYFTGMTPLAHLVEQNHAAANTNPDFDVAMIDYLINDKANIKATSTVGANLLMTCVQVGNTKLLQKFLPSLNVHHKDIKGNTALHYLCLYFQNADTATVLFQMLMQAGADVFTKNLENRNFLELLVLFGLDTTDTNKHKELTKFSQWVFHHLQQNHPVILYKFVQETKIAVLHQLLLASNFAAATTLIQAGYPINQICNNQNLLRVLVDLSRKFMNNPPYLHQINRFVEFLLEKAGTPEMHLADQSLPTHIGKFSRHDLVKPITVNYGIWIPLEEKNWVCIRNILIFNKMNSLSPHVYEALLVKLFSYKDPSEWFSLVLTDICKHLPIPSNSKEAKITVNDRRYSPAHWAIANDNLTALKALIEFNKPGESLIKLLAYANIEKCSPEIHGYLEQELRKKSANDAIVSAPESRLFKPEHRSKHKRSLSDSRLKL